MFLWSLLLLMSQARDAHLECGERPMFARGAQYSRITGGIEAGVGEFPWQVSIQARNEHFCGGAILNEWWIITAAHCFYPEQLPPTDLRVVLGTNSLTSPSLEIKGVTTIIRHKDFQRVSMDNDIALLMLDNPITFNELKEPICLPMQPGLSQWHKCWVAGWGQVKSGLNQPMETELLKAPMTIMNWDKCFKEFPKLTKNMLCAGYENESYDSCQGDSGGPLACTQESGKKWYHVGIISWGRSCGLKNTPGIYTLLENYHSWIKKVTELEGRPFRAEQMVGTSKQKAKVSRASEFPKPGSPTLWLLLCLLPYVTF
ncbi:serine protease 55 [Bos indicus]|uniref:Serine protease 55 n=2 Tax=Bos TaxID=9903 RepID=A0A6P5C740_BOSIN|nr:serine protease 55 [Bos taurus]